MNSNPRFEFLTKFKLSKWQLGDIEILFEYYEFALGNLSGRYGEKTIGAHMRSLKSELAKLTPALERAYVDGNAHAPSALQHPAPAILHTAIYVSMIHLPGAPQ
jgi:hypothetical protein